MSFPPFISALKLNVSMGASPNVQTFEQDIHPSDLSGTTTNSVLITNSDLLNAFNSQPLGTTFTPSIVTTYEGFPLGNSLSSESSSPFVPRQITTNLSFQHIPDLNALTAPFELIVSTNSPVARAPLSFSSSNPNVLSVSSSGLVTAQGSGTVTITASQEISSDNIYTAATFVSRVIVVKEILTLSNFTIPAKNFGDAPFTLSAPTTNSGGAFSYTSSDESVATVNYTTGLVTIVGGGTTIITAIQAATNNYTSATITASLVVARWTQRGLDIDGEAANDYSGKSVSLSSDGNTVAIGAPDNGDGGSYAGHVRVYHWTGSSWAKRGSDIDGEAADDSSGDSVSLSSDGNTVAIGAPYNYGARSYAGHVRVYDWNGSSWAKRGSDINGEGAYDYSGDSVSLSSDGNTLAIGADSNDGKGSNAGHVRVYEWNTTTTPNQWTKRGSDIDGEAAWDNSGHSVSLSSDGNTVAIGAPNNDGIGSNAGHVRVYYWNTAITPNGWTKRGQDIDGEAADDYSGYSVSLSSDGNTVAIGADSNDGAGSNAGHVRVYDWNGSSWAKRGSDIDGEAANDYSGYSVSLSSDGNTVAIGAPYNDGTGSNAGHVRVYDWTGLSWAKRGQDIDGEAPHDQSGYSVSLSSDGNTVAIGAPFNDGTGSNAGHVRVYTWQ